MRFAALVATVGMLLVPSVPAVGARHGCGSTGHTIARTHQVRVYTLPVELDFYSIYGCLRRTGRTVRIGTTNDGPSLHGESIYAVRAAGEYMTYDHLLCDHGDCYGGIRVLNLATRVKRHGQELRAGDQEVTDNVLTRRGSAAWIRKRIVHADEFYVVRTLDRRGREHRVGFAPDINPTSLTYNPQTRRASWLQRGTRHTAFLP
jgi:hypothetical protein